MANRFPLIINALTNIIEELPATDNLDLSSSGISNLAIGNLKVTGGTSGQVITTDGTGNLTFTTSGSGIPGSNTQLIYNDAGSLNGASTLTFNNGTDTLSVLNAVVSNLDLTKFDESVVDGGSTGAATISPNASLGSIYKFTATGNFTLNSLTSAVAGTSMTIIIQQDATGGRTLTSSMLFAGGLKTLSTAANAIDIISVFFDGTIYYAALSKGYA